MSELDQAKAMGVEFSLCGLPHYHLDLSPDEVRRLIEVGRERFLCEYFGVTAEVWEAFLAHAGPHAPCSATTRAGNPCRGYVEPYFGSPDGFVLGVNDRCHAHQGVR